MGENVLYLVDTFHTLVFLPPTQMLRLPTLPACEQLMGNEQLSIRTANPQLFLPKVRICLIKVRILSGQSENLSPLRRQILTFGRNDCGVAVLIDS